MLWSAITLGVAISFLARFRTGAGGLQFVTDKVWISALGIHYKLGLDGLNVALVVTTTIIFAAALLWASTHGWERPRLFYFHFALAESAVLGAFCAQDLALFVAFFDLMLIPFYFLAGIWGGPDRVRATTRLVIYTLVGSFFMLVAAVATGVLASSQNGAPLTFVLSSLRGLPLSHATQTWVFLAFAVAFLVKMPLVPFHGWLPDGYKAMPIPAVAVFSRDPVQGRGLRLPADRAPAVPLRLRALPDADADHRPGLDPVGDARGLDHPRRPAGRGLFQRGPARLHHPRDVLAAPQGDQGALLQMVNHALVTAPLFFIVAALAARAGGSEKLADMGGIAFRAPILASLFLIVVVGQAGHARVVQLRRGVHDPAGLFKAKLAMALMASLGVVGAAAYALRAVHRRRCTTASARRWARLSSRCADALADRRPARA